ncbi:MAG: hypothetical protein PHT54_04660 [Candidatus Nanoarchaeia archaeon]|nr:hypothetical protein [Candidatus Nanoarchaeia archaeon]
MATISHLVKKYVDENPFIVEGITRGIISNPGLAEEFRPKIEKELKKKVDLSAIVMALRRYTEKIEEKHQLKKKKKVSSELVIKTGLCVLALKKSFSIFKKLDTIYPMINYEKGDIFKVSQGSNSISMIVSEDYTDKILKILKNERILKKQHDLVAVNILFSKEYLFTPGMIYLVTRNLAWNNINIVELFSAYSELSIVIEKKDSVKAYEVLQEMMN